MLFTASTINSSQIFLYDSASSTPQQLVSTGSVPPEPRFIAAQKMAYVDTTDQMTSRIRTVDLSTHASTTEVSANGYVPAFAFSHDGSLLAYLVHDQQSKASLHQRRGGQDHVYNLNPIPGRGSTRDDEVRLEYSPDDKYLLMVDTYLGNQGQAPETGQFLVLRSSDLSVAFVPPAGISSNATMATWARHMNRLFYRDAIGVRTWTAEDHNIGTLVAGLHWYDPAPSADDRWLAFTDIDTQFVPHVRLYDLQTNQIAATVSAARSHPIFITAASLWDLEEQPCQSECLAGPSQTSGKAFAYALDSKRESSLPFSDVHTLSQLAVAFSP